MAAKDNVVIRMSAEDAGAFEAWRKAAKGPEQMGQAIEDAATKGKRASEELGHVLNNQVGHWASIAGQIELVKKGLEEYYNLMKEHRTHEENATRQIDAGIAGYAQVQRLYSPQAREHAAQRIGGRATAAGVTPEAAFSAATMLGEFGVGNEEATGGALAELLQLQNATAGSGLDPAQFSRKVLEIIKRSSKGGKVDRASIHKLGAAARTLIGRAAGFDQSELEEYANVANAAQVGGLDQGTGLALWAAIREKEGRPRSARTLFESFMKPGMQKGEKEYLARARGFLSGADTDYTSTADIQRRTLGAREQAAVTQRTFNEYEPGIASSKMVHENLVNILRANYGKHPVNEAFEELLLTGHETASYLYGGSEEDAVNSMVSARFPSNERSTRAQSFRRQLLGREKIPSPKRVEVDVNVRGAHGLDIPADVDARHLDD